MFQKLSQHEHILQRPDTYIGSIHQEQKNQLIYDHQTKNLIKEHKYYIPALENLFFHIIWINHSTNNMDIVVDAKTINVIHYNQLISTEFNSDHNKYVPELLFSEHNLYENIYSRAIFVNVWSINFTIIIHNAEEKRKYTQMWKNNMLDNHDPIIEDYDGDVSSLQIICTLDFEKLNIDSFSSSDIKLFARHALEISLADNRTITFNNVTFNIQTIDITNQDYLIYKRLYTNSLKTTQHKFYRQIKKIGFSKNPEIVYTMLLRLFLKYEVFRIHITEPLSIDLYTYAMTF